MQISERNEGNSYKNASVRAAAKKDKNWAETTEEVFFSTLAFVPSFPFVPLIDLPNSYCCIS